RLGRYRQHYDLVAQGTDPSAPSAPVISEVLDLSHGVSGTYPTFRIPATWEENNGNEGAAQWQPMWRDYQSQRDAYNTLERNLLSQINWQTMDQAAVNRFLALMGAIYATYLQPTIKPLYDAWDSSQRAMSAFFFDYS